jgi:MFS family permease
MRRNLVPVFALLLGTLFLFLGSGLHSLLLPLRGTEEGYSTTVLGLLGTSWSGGFVTGCFLAPLVVRRIGHVRAFSGFLALTAIIALLTGILVDPIAWIVLRAATGFASAGTSMIIESWLNERADNTTRGTIFSTYIMITLAGVVGGQMMVASGDIHSTVLFMIVGILYCVAILPTTLSTAASPQPLKSVKLDIVALYKNSPIASVGMVLIGISNGAFGTLGAVFGAKANLSSGHIALMMSLAIFAGAIMQLPAGRLSDRIDRRLVLAGLAAVCAFAGWLLVLFQPSNVIFLLVVTSLYGAAANSLYPIAAAHANDHASPENYVKVSGGLLLLYGIGTIIGPTVGGPVMSFFGPYALFAITALAHIAITVYAVFRSRVRAPIPVEDRDGYLPVGHVGVKTPESFNFSPRNVTTDEVPVHVFADDTNEDAAA